MLRASAMPSSRAPLVAAAIVAGFLPLLVSITACDVFDPALYLARAGPPDAAADQGPAVARPEADTGTPLLLADRCEQSPAVLGPDALLDIDTSRLGGDYGEFMACVGHDLPGNDGFIMVNMTMNERWHVHVTPVSEGFDPAIYVLPSCDERACSKVTAIDACGPNKSEHLSFVAPRTGPYLIGIDSPNPGGGAAKVLVIRPICGNSLTEHAETCDDGNTVSGDGCDALCRQELTTFPASEVEPNDDPRAANVLAPAARAGASAVMTVMANLATPCEDDLFALALSEGGAVRARVSGAGAPCAEAAAELTLVSGDGQTELVSATAGDGNACAGLEAKALHAGQYYLAVRRRAGERVWPYLLTVEVP